MPEWLNGHDPKGTRWVLESENKSKDKPLKMNYYLYVLQSLKRKRFYIGVTKNIKERLKKHNNSSTRSTRPYRPWKLIYWEKFNDKQEAYKREFFLKSPKGFLEKKRIIEEHRIKVKYPQR